ncbi:MAG TPA: hypothetical protein VG797_07195 [Phycisphaerales bacterium]|nr:hypothetical protein [Phycisphaerales bacterium]
MEGRLPIRAVAGCFALSAFAIAIVSGLAAERSADEIILSAIIGMFICQFIGVAAGKVACVALSERLSEHRADREARIGQIGNETTVGAGQSEGAVT